MRGTVTTILTTLVTLPAAASPWAQGDGEVYSRLAVSTEEVDGVAAWRVDSYFEYGLTNDWTLTGKAEAVRFENAADFDNDSYRLTLRRQMFQRGGWVGALEGGILEGGALGNLNTCETLGGEARASIGWSGVFREKQTFTFGEIAGRVHESCERHRAEFGWGRQVSDSIWSISQVWVERGTQKASSDKIQSELLWRANAFDYSLGYRQEVGGQFEEEAVFVSVVRRF